jgi:hypothetical protein
MGDVADLNEIRLTECESLLITWDSIFYGALRSSSPMTNEETKDCVKSNWWVETTPTNKTRALRPTKACRSTQA